jgi:hypothetical protein
MSQNALKILNADVAFEQGVLKVCYFASRLRVCAISSSNVEADSTP